MKDGDRPLTLKLQTRANTNLPWRDVVVAIYSVAHGRQVRTSYRQFSKEHGDGLRYRLVRTRVEVVR